MDSFVKMRDRRNTSLSISSTASTPSTFSPSSRSSLSEKRHASPPPESLVALPSPINKANTSRQPPTRSRSKMAIKIALWLCALVLIWHLSSLRSAIVNEFRLVTGKNEESSSVPIVVGGSMPDQPSTLILSDSRGAHRRWTVYIPNNHSFPLTHHEYEELCEQCDTVRSRLGYNSRLFQSPDWQRYGGFYSRDRTYLDVQKAEEAGALRKQNAEASSGVCERSLTFVFDEEEVNLGSTLLLLWLSYGLAKKEGRSFFIDDSNWPYGSYASFFTPPPSPDCRPPQARYIVPCPHNARHLMVSAATAPWTFGSKFDREYLKFSSKGGVERSRQVFDFLRAGHDDLFHLAGEDGYYATARIAQFTEEAKQSGTATVGIHIRRGDGHPAEYQFSRDYLPIERYAIAARELDIKLSHATSSLPNQAQAGDSQRPENSILLASDDPSILVAPELTQLFPPSTVHAAQERIQLATKAALDQAGLVGDSAAMATNHLDEVNAGWDGGFYKALFFSLGREHQHHALPGSLGHGRATSEPSAQLRELVARAYFLDLAVLSQADAVVCGVSSATCRALGVMMGWEAVMQGRWINVDDGRVWSWDGRK